MQANKKHQEKQVLGILDFFQVNLEGEDGLDCKKKKCCKKFKKGNRCKKCPS